MVESLSDLKLTENKSLSDILSENYGVIIIFLPNLTSVTSTTQLKDIRNNYYKFKNLGWELICVTTAIESEFEQFLTENKNNFLIIHDKNRKISTHFDVQGKLKNKYWQVLRKSIFVKNNKILYSYDKTRPALHSTDLLTWLKENNEFPSDSASEQVYKQKEVHSRE